MRVLFNLSANERGGSARPQILGGKSGAHLQVQQLVPLAISVRDCRSRMSSDHDAKLKAQAKKTRRFPASLFLVAREAEAGGHKDLTDKWRNPRRRNRMDPLGCRYP